MQELTLEQRRAIALAEARRRQAQAQGQGQPQRQVSTDPRDMIPTDEPGQGGFITREQSERQRQERLQGRAREYVREQPLAHPVSFQGLSQAFNMSDELMGAMASNRGLPGDVAADEQRQLVQNFRSQAPGQAALYEGMATLPLALFGGGGSSLGNAARVGAAYGAAAGAGEGETVPERMQNAAQGGAAGGVLGAVGQQAIRAGSAVLTPLARAVQRRLSGNSGNMTRAQRRAFAELRSAFRDDGMSGPQVREALQQYRDAGFDDATLLDAGGQNVQRLVRRAGTQGGPAGEDLQNLLQQRLDTQAERVGERLSSMMSGSGNYGQALRTQVTERARAAAPLYQQAFGDADNLVTISRAPVASVLDRAPSRALATARRLARLDGRDAGSLTGENVAVRDLHYLKMALDDIISSSRRGQNSIGNTQRAGLERLRGELLNAMPENYRAANNSFAGDSALIDAMRAGRTALRGDAEEVEALLSSASQGEREMFRAGLVRAAQEQAERAGDGSEVVRRIIGNRDRRRRLASAFDTPEEFDGFVNSLRAEQSRVTTARAVAPTTGSQTELRRNDAMDEAGNFLRDLSNADLGNAMTRVARGVGGNIGQRSRNATNQELVRMATAVRESADDNARQILLREVERAYGSEVAQRVNALASRALPAAAAGAATTVTQ